jgi:subtilisin-like proprotein convertase family protein
MNDENDFYYARGKKIRLIRSEDTFAIRYKEGYSSARMMDTVDRLHIAAERKELPKHRTVLVTMPPTRALADIRTSRERLQADENVEFIAPVFTGPTSKLRLIPTGEITARFKPEVSKEQIAKFNAQHDVEIIEENDYVPNQYLLKANNPDKTLEVANEYNSSNLTVFAEPNFLSEFEKYAFQPPPNDPYFGEQWHLENTGQGDGLAGEDVSAIDAWKITAGDPKIVIAIIDDGVDIDHPDLKDNIWENPDPSKKDRHGRNFYDDADPIFRYDPRPRYFGHPYHEHRVNDNHGTPCAGVAAAAGNNQIGVAGIAFNCKILPVKIFGADEMARENKVADAIRYAGSIADVLSCSWGWSSDTPSSDISLAIGEVARTGRKGKGAAVLCATGNKTSPILQTSISFPASVPEAIAVGASTNKGERAQYSCYGVGIDFVAPSNGGTKGIFTTDISTLNRGYNTGDISMGDPAGLYYNDFGGTSSATPLAAGIAALILSVNPNLTQDQVRQIMRNTADKIGGNHNYNPDGFSVEYGYGRVNAYKAVKAAKVEQPPTNIIHKETSPGVEIPDNEPKGIDSVLNITESGEIANIKVSVDIAHTWIGDLTVTLIAPSGEEVKLHDRSGSSTNDIVKTYDTNIAPGLQSLVGMGVQGEWKLKVADHASRDIGTLNQWGLEIGVVREDNIIRQEISPGAEIPDNYPDGVDSVLDISRDGKITDIKISVDITHTWIGDLTVTLVAPSSEEVKLHNRTGGSEDNIIKSYDVKSTPELQPFLGKKAKGNWTLNAADHVRRDTGKLNNWGIEITLGE